jgi:uncharacterized protein
MGQVSLLVKATRLCNLRCAYCYEWRSGPDQTMPFPVAARLIAAALTDEEHDHVRFTWHGGEPTVMPVDFYRRMLWVQSRFRRPQQVVTNAIVTNGTRLTPEWLEFLAQHEFGVSVSIDGPAELHDTYRIDAAGRPTHARVIAGLEALREYGISFGILMVVDRAAVDLGPDAIFDYFLDIGVRSYGFNFVMPAAEPDAAAGTPAAHYITPAEKEQFLVRLYDRWVAHGDPTLRVRELAAFQERVWGKPALMCTLAGRCIGGIYAIEPNGDVTHCDFFLGDSRYRWGNITTQNFRDIRRSLNMATARAEREQALERMRGCQYFGVCQGGCPHEQYASLRHNPSHVDDCCGMAGVIRRIQEQSTAVARA